MTIPGTNYGGKPYCDIGDALPNVGDRVVYLPFTGGVHIEGRVIEIDCAQRRVKIDAVKSQGGVQESLTGVWLDWRDLEVCP